MYGLNDQNKQKVHCPIQAATPLDTQQAKIKPRPTPRTCPLTCQLKSSSRTNGSNHILIKESSVPFSIDLKPIASHSPSSNPKL